MYTVCEPVQTNRTLSPVNLPAKADRKRRPGLCGVPARVSLLQPLLRRRYTLGSGNHFAMSSCPQ